MLDDKEKLRVVEEILLLAFENDDSYVIDMVVRQIRNAINDPRFAFGAAFEEEWEQIKGKT